MGNRILTGILAVGLFTTYFVVQRVNLKAHSTTGHSKNKTIETAEYPYGYFWFRRIGLMDSIPYSAIKRARLQAEQLKTATLADSQTVWYAGGPYNIGGRITAIAANPDDPSTVYAGAADGGVLKSTNGGLNWTPIFDDMPSLSIGAIALNPQNPDEVFVGTGEANSSGDSFNGTGLYKSPDGGQTWIHLGLENTKHINRIVFNPDNSDVIFVAAMGGLFSADTSRGVYRTTDGGQTWEKVLFVSDSTGCIDLAINPQNPNIVYAAMWERIRHPWHRRVGGPTSGIYRSTDGGDTWELLTNGLPSGNNVGRIGLAISQSNPDILYAIYADDPGHFMGVYKTVDGGNSWYRVNDSELSDLFSSYGWYFGNIRVNPNNPNDVYAMGLHLYRSTDGGNSWYSVTGYYVHADQHDLWIDPNNTLHLILGNDGGIYISQNGGNNWQKSSDLPVTQFYRVTVDFSNPERIYGGTQDNGTIRTLTGNLYDWQLIYGGDGFFCIVDYTNPNIIYAEYQYGGLGKSTDGGYTFFDATSGIDPYDRRNWNTPVVMDPNDHNVLYYGTFRLYKTTNGANSWYPVSNDLTNGPYPGEINYGTITAIAVAPSNSNVIYVGTDDGNLWITQDGGSNWTYIANGTPARWVTDIAVHPDSSDIAYATFSGYVLDDHTPYVMKTENAGTSWVDITGNLPQAPVNTVVIDTLNNWLIVGTDFGVYFTTDEVNWQPLGVGLPNSVVNDMVFHEETRKLVVGTHGRSTFYLYLPTGVEEQYRLPILAKKAIHLKGNVFRNEIDFVTPKDSRFALQVVDLSGRVVMSTGWKSWRRGAHRFGVDLPGGIYFLKVIGENRSALQTEKIIVLR